jgi:hypothetical protein
MAWGEMYNHDSVNIVSLAQQTRRKTDAETWGSKMLDLVWQFVMDMWFTRNQSEHNHENKGTEIGKRKLAEQIIWVKEKIPNTVNHPYSKVTFEGLQKLPTSNLSIMCEQLMNIYEKNRLNSYNFEIT